MAPPAPVSAPALSQPDFDHTIQGNYCFITQNGNSSNLGDASQSDVDNGKTTIFSPIFDLSSFAYVLITDICDIVSWVYVLTFLFRIEISCNKSKLGIYMSFIWMYYKVWFIFQDY